MKIYETERAVFLHTVENAGWQKQTGGAERLECGFCGAYLPTWETEGGWLFAVACHRQIDDGTWGMCDVDLDPKSDQALNPRQRLVIVWKTAGGAVTNRRQAIDNYQVKEGGEIK